MPTGSQQVYSTVFPTSTELRDTLQALNISGYSGTAREDGHHRESHRNFLSGNRIATATIDEMLRNLETLDLSSGHGKIACLRAQKRTKIFHKPNSCFCGCIF